MKGKLFIIAVCAVALVSIQAQASVFSSSGATALQSTFRSLGYDYIDVTDYQTDLNMQLAGMVEFQLLNRGMSNVSFGVLEARRSYWGQYYRHHQVLGENSRVGSLGRFNMDSPRSTYSFYIEARDPYRYWRTNRYYSYSPYNQYSATQALFYRNPHDSDEILIAFSGHRVGDTRYDRRYDDMIVRARVHPAPEPATWLLLGTGLSGLGVFVRMRRRQEITG